MIDQEQPEVTAPPETKPETESIDERMLKSAQAQWQSAAEESAAEEPEKAAEAKAAEDAAEKPDEAKDEPKTEEPFSTEQLGDPKFYDGLKKEGWAKLEKLHPVEYARVKAAYSAAGKIYEAARKQEAKAKPDTALDAPAQKQLSPEWEEATRKANSLDATEAAEGLQKIVELTLAQSLPKFGFDPTEAKTLAVTRTAYAAVVADMPEIANLDIQQLDAIVDGDEALTNLLELAADLPDQKRVAITATVMKKAAEALLAKNKSESEAATATQKAKDEKTKAQQAKVRSNANIASNVVVESPAAGTPKAKKTMEERAAEMWSEAAAAQGS